MVSSVLREEDAHIVTSRGTETTQVNTQKREHLDQQRSCAGDPQPVSGSQMYLWNGSTKV